MSLSQTSEVNKKFSEEIGLPGNSEKIDETILQGSCKHLSALKWRTVKKTVYLNIVKSKIQ